jgi:hypothetical protein
MGKLENEEVKNSLFQGPNEDEHVEERVCLNTS